jgi:hypothetical protein
MNKVGQLKVKVFSAAWETPLPYTLGQGSCDFPNDAGNFWWSAGAMLHTTLIYSFHSYFQIKVFIHYSNLA